MISLEELNFANESAFVTVCGPLFEHSPWIAQRASALRPFSSRVQLHEVMCQIVTSSMPAQQLELINAHPDLVGRLAREGRLTSQSSGEQAAAGLSQVSPEEARQFDQHNTDYKTRFGFPFVICARENKKQAILDAFPKRLQNDRDAEIRTALTEIYKIAKLRLIDAVSE